MTCDLFKWIHHKSMFIAETSKVLSTYQNLESSIAYDPQSSIQTENVLQEIELINRLFCVA
jgi:hypothetical protein